MRSFIFCVVGLLGSVVIAPTVCPAQDSDRSFFPLPLSVEVGDGWTYSIVRSFLDTLATKTLTIRVVERLQIEDQTYFELSDGGIYRVDKESRTWRYDTYPGSERIVWDIWGEKVEVCNGHAWPRCLERHGPFVRKVVQRPEVGEVEGWFVTKIGADSEPYDWSIGALISRPHTLTYADLLKYSDWGVTEFYGFDYKEHTNRVHLIVAPNVGVVYYAISYYVYDPFSPIAGKVGTSDSSPRPMSFKQKTEWILQDVQKGDPESTVIEDISFGQLKQRMKHPAPNAP